MAFEKLAHGIPLHEAAAFFIKLKTASDNGGALEGQFAAPVEEVLAQMAEHVQSELRTQYAYLVYSQSLRDLSHFAIAEELEEHAAQETEHAEFLLRRMSVLGGDVAVPDIPAPPPSSDPVMCIKTLIQFEQEGIAHWQKLRALVGEDNPTRFKIEEYLATEQEHLDELWQMLPHGEATAAAGAPPQAIDPKAAMSQPVAEGEPLGAPDQGLTPPPNQGEATKAAGTDIEHRISKLLQRRPDLASKFASAKAADGEMATGKLPPVTPMPALSGPAAGQLSKIAERMKRALAEMPTAAQPVPGGPEHNELQQYLASEGAAMEGQNQAEDGYYRQRFADAMERLQAAEAQAQAAEQQVATLQEQVNAGATQNQEALAQAQQIQQAAMQQANAANTAAAAAMQQSLASSNETLQQQQLTTQMRDAVQGLKQQLMGLVNTQLPPSTTMEAGVSGAADQAAADQQAQEQAMMGGQDPSGNQAGTPAASGDAGTPPGSSTPGKDGPGPSPTASDPSSSPAANRSSASSETAPGADGPDEPAKQASDRFVGALMGGLAGAGITAAESRMSNDPLRDKVKKLEAAEASGEGGFGNAMNLAQSKMRLAMGELMEKHPVGASLVGAGLGARAGAAAAPAVRDIATHLRG